MMKVTRNYDNDDSGSIGIGAMIVFIALILVAAVASAVIIQTGEKLQQNAQQTGSDTQQEISGKISINSIFVYDEANTYLMYFESSAGSGMLEETTIQYQMTCFDGANYQYVAGDLTDTTAVDDVGGAILGAANQIEPGVNYAIILDANPGGAFGDCSADTVGVNGDITLWIHVEQGGSTYETLYISDDSAGALVI